MRELIANPSQLTPGLLTEILYKDGALSQGKATKIVQELRRDNENSLIISLSITYSDDATGSTPKRLLFKCSKKGFKGAEVAFYTDIAPNIPNAHFVKCYDAFYSEEDDTAHLILEDISETHTQLWQGLTLTKPNSSVIEQIIEAYAQFHIYCWDKRSIADRLGIRRSESTLRKQFNTTQNELAEFFGFFGERFTSDQHQAFEKVTEKFPELLIQRLVDGKNLTFIHRDTHLGNILVPSDPDEENVYVIDWTHMAMWYSSQDLASHITRFWSPDLREGMEQVALRKYYDMLIDSGIENYTWQDFWYDYRLGVTEMFYRLSWVGQYKRLHESIYWILDNVVNAYEDLECAELI